MTMKTAAFAAALGALAMGAAGSASAAHMTISGIWSSYAPTTPYSQAEESYSVSFDIPNTFTSTLVAPGIIQTTDFSNYSYLLNGVAVTSPYAIPDEISFFSGDNGGGLALGYTDNADNIEFLGTPLATTNGVTDQVIMGTFTLVPNVAYSPDGPDGSFNEGTGLGVTVPEPSTWALAFLGFGLTGAAMRQARRKAAVAHAA